MAAPGGTADGGDVARSRPTPAAADIRPAGHECDYPLAMKKDVIATPLLPFTDDEEAALDAKLNAMDAAALGTYVESAKLALGNRALDASWRPRIQLGLTRAEAVIAAQALLPIAVDEPAPPVVPKAAKTAKASKAAKPAVEA